MNATVRAASLPMLVLDVLRKSGLNNAMVKQEDFPRSIAYS